MNRRGFLGAILVAGVAPAIVKASSLMKLAAPEIWTPPATFVLPSGTIPNPTFTGYITFATDMNTGFWFMTKREIVMVKDGEIIRPSPR